MDRDGIRIRLLKCLWEGVGTMRGTIVHNPKDPTCVPIRFAPQHLTDEACKGRDTSAFLGSAHHVTALHIERCQVGKRAPTLITMIHTLQRMSKARRANRTVPGLDAGLLIGRDD